MIDVRDIDYEAGGVTMRGRLAVPDGPGPFPGVLVAHEANGLDDFQVERPEALAEEGYAAFALDYYGGRVVAATQQEMFPRLNALIADPATVRARAHAGLAVLVGDERVDAARVGAIGYCFGETVITELARDGADLKALVGCHPGLNTLEGGATGPLRAKVLMCIGALDPMVPAGHREAWAERMTAEGVDWRMNLYGGAGHSYTHPHSEAMGIDGLAYHGPSADAAWRALLDHLAETLT